MKIAIHKRVGSFSDRWINYCEMKSIPYKIVNCYDTEIVSQLEGVSGLMWHWDQNDYKTVLFARQLTIALEKKGVNVFPDINTCWHFDDKLGQKYLLEAIKAPLIKSYVFYSFKDAEKWIKLTSFPKVFKLRGGAGSVNVKLLKSKSLALKYSKIAFSNGFSSIDKWTRLKDKYWAFKRNKSNFALREFLSSIKRFFIPLDNERFFNREKGYVYLQDFVPENDHDTRIVVIGNRCFAVRRYCRDDDFRASGSGIVCYDYQLIDKRMLRIAFDIALKLKTQSIAFDFILDKKEPKLIEISYCFALGAFYDNCEGYWDSNLTWYDKEVNPQFFMIEDFINLCEKKQRKIF